MTMWQMRLFGKADQYIGSVSSDEYNSDTRDQWSVIIEMSGNIVYNDVDVITVKCNTKFKNGDNILIAYDDNIVFFGYISRAKTLIADAQYEFDVTEYLNMLNKYPVPRFGTTTYEQISNKNVSMRSRIDNFSFPGGKKTIQEIMDTVIVGAGSKWSHKVDDYYYNNNMSKCSEDLLGPYYRWESMSPGSGYWTDRWYNIPMFTQVPGSYGQLPTAPNYDLRVDGVDIVKQITASDPKEIWDQVCYIPWTPDEEDETPEASLLEFKKKIVHYIPTIELCATTVFATCKRMLIELCKMNVWCEALYKGGEFSKSVVDGESIDDVKFVVKYGYVRNHRITTPLQIIQYRCDDQAEDKDIECVLVFGYDHSKDVGMAIKPGSSVPYTTAMWEYKDGRNEQELDALAYQIMTDFQKSNIVHEVDLRPGPPIYDGTYVINVGDVIRVQSNELIEYHKTLGWYEGSNTRYAKRMKELVSKGYASADRNDALFTVKAIKYSISKTTLELDERRGNIFDIMGDRLSRIEGTTQEYDIDSLNWKKADIQLNGRPDGEYPYTITDESVADYGNVLLSSSLPVSDTGIPTNFLTWNGIKWVNADTYTGNNYPAWTSILLMVKDESHMSEIPDSRGMVPLEYIGPWFNFEVKVLGSKPSLSQALSGSGMDYNNVSVGNAWVIPYQYNHTNAQSVMSDSETLQKLVNEGSYEFPDVKCRLPESWRKNIYFDSETDCMIAPELLIEKSGGAASIGCLNYLKIGAIPKGFNTAKIDASISFFNQCFAEGSGDSTSSLDATITSRGCTPKACMSFNFQWCLGRDSRPRSTAYNEVTKENLNGYWKDGDFINDVWDDNPECQWDGKWISELITPNWSSGYAIQTATLHSELSISDKRVDSPITDLSLYLRYVVIFNSHRQYTSLMYSFLAMAGWSVSVVCTPGYELLDEWYKIRTHVIQLMIDGNGEWNNGGQVAKAPISVIIHWPDPTFTNEDGYFCFDIRKFLGEGYNYIRMRSIKEISSGIFSPAELMIKGEFISGWLKD